MSATWTDSSLNFQEQLFREEMDSLRKRIEYAEESLLITLEVNKEESESMDPALPQKVQRFREYLEKLRETLRQLQSIGR